MRIRKIQNKKAVSLMVSYVLLIVIAMGLAAGVYSFLKFRATIPQEEGCPGDAVLTIRSYNCDNQTAELTVEIENRGLFNISGFFIRASNDTNIPPIIPLQSTDTSAQLGEETKGSYYFENPLSPNTKQETHFTYAETIPLKKIEIQPFIIKERLKSCKDIITLTIDDSRNCNLAIASPTGTGDSSDSGDGGSGGGGGGEII